MRDCVVALWPRGPILAVESGPIEAIRDGQYHKLKKVSLNQNDPITRIGQANAQTRQVPHFGHGNPAKYLFH